MSKHGHIDPGAPPDRETYAPRFGFHATNLYDIVTIDGVDFLKIRRVGGKLPRGFQDRLFQHIADMLTGRKSALWDEQAIYGEYKRNAEHTRLNGERRADQAMRDREDGTK